MFAAWCQKQSDKYVARTCNVLPKTAKRYREKYDWVGRLERVRTVMTSLDSGLGEIREQFIVELRNIQTIVMEYIKTVPFKNPKYAAAVYMMAVDRILEYKGHMTPKDAGLFAIARMRIQADDKERNKREIPAKVTDVEDGVEGDEE